MGTMLRLLGVGLVTLLTTGARDQGCIGPLEPDPSASLVGETSDAGEAPDETQCPALACRLACANGLATDAAGCSLCECADDPAPVSCLTDDDCNEGITCDIVNYCDPPPGCEDGEACPGVCYGRCVGSQPSGDEALCKATNGRWDPTSCGHYACGQPPMCEALIPGCDCGEGATFVEGKGCVASDACEPSCHDGSQLACRMMQPQCDAPLVAAVQNGCWVCADPSSDCRIGCSSDDDCQGAQRCTASASGCDAATTDCDRPRGVCVPLYAGCLSDAECARGEICLPTPGAPCPDDDPSCVPMAGVCVAANECPPVTCDLGCEHGFAVDASGCETCACNEAPSECACTEEYAPVCGADGHTYPNACHAACADVRVVADGECTAECDLHCLVPEPVCGADGVTYVCGEVESSCHGVEVAYAGECRGCTSGTDCAWGQKCHMAADGASRCVDVTWCQTDSDCTGLASSAAWVCKANVCTAR